MAFFQAYETPRASGPRVEYVTLFDPRLALAEEDIHHTILLHLAPHRTYTTDEKLRHIGLIQGLDRFGGSFSSSSPLATVSTSHTRLAMTKLPEGRFLAMCVRLGRTVVGGESAYTSTGMPPMYVLNAVLERGHELYQLHHGQLTDRACLADWWERYLRTSLFLTHWEGCFDRFPAVRKAPQRLLRDTRREFSLVQRETGAEHLLVFHLKLRELGLVCQTEPELPPVDCYRLFQWLEGVSAEGLTPENLIGDLPMNQGQTSFDPTATETPPTPLRKTYAQSLFSFNPLKAMNQLSSQTLDAVQTAAAFRWSRAPETRAVPPPPPTSPKGLYLIGLHETTKSADPDMHKTITNKEVFLTAGKQFVVMYQYERWVVVLLGAVNTPELQLKAFYTQTEARFMKAFETEGEIGKEGEIAREGEISREGETIREGETGGEALWAGLVAGVGTLQLMATLTPNPTRPIVGPFYYYIYDFTTQVLETSLPKVALTNRSTNPFDLAENPAAGVYIHTVVLAVIEKAHRQRATESMAFEAESICKTDNNWMCYSTMRGAKVVVVVKALLSAEPLKHIIEGNTSPHLVRMMGHEVQMWVDSYTATGNVPR